MNIQQRIAGHCPHHQDYLRGFWACGCGQNFGTKTDWAAHLVSELKLRENPTTGYLDPAGFLHSWSPQGGEYRDYVQYISDWHEAEERDGD